jgi:hypothetical protein
VPRDCCSAEELCSFHLYDEFEGRKGLAYGRGREWAERVARKVGRSVWRTRDWPDSPKMRRIARRLVGGLAQDQRLLEKFAACCAEGAALRWNVIQRYWK